jgi:hypothetical protein
MCKKWLVFGLVLGWGSVPDVHAGMLVTTFGNPTGASTARSEFGISNLDPGAAVERTSTDRNTTPLQLFLIAMDAQGFNRANGWRFNLGSLANNDLTLQTYVARANGPVGGADFALNYTAQGADPANVRWIQVIETNTRTFSLVGATRDPFSPGLNVAVDDGLNPRVGGRPTSPFYDPAGAANATSFSDTPRLLFDPDRNPVVGHFYTFLVTQDPRNPRSLTLLDDVEWGFRLNYVPNLFSYSFAPTPDRVLQGNDGSVTITVSNNTNFPLRVTDILGPQPIIGKLDGGDLGDSILNPRRTGGTLQVGTVLTGRGNPGSSGTIIDTFSTFDNRNPDPNVDTGYWNIGNLVGVRATVPINPPIAGMPNLSYPFLTKVDAPVEVFDPVAAPEPSSLFLMTSGLVGLAWWRRKVAA